jgi:hypothetical protein
MNSGIADAQGAYCIPDLPAGAYSIRVTARTQPSSASPSCHRCCDASLEFPTLLRERALTVVAGKATVPIDLRLQRVPAFCVRGEVRDRNGTLRTDVAVGLEEGSWATGVFTEGGKFLLTHLPPGDYVLVVSEHPQLGRELLRRTIRLGAANIPRLVLTLP